jgi:hypothetical protein
VIGRPVKVQVEVDPTMSAAAVAAPAEAISSSDTENELTQRATSHPGVKRFQELFPDAQIRSVRNLNE